MGQERTGTMTTRLELGAERPGLRLGFTLVELMVVMTIIGIILAFLLVAAGDARRRAEQDATLALITKLEGGINDRLDALLQTRPDPNPGARLHWREHLLPRATPPLPWSVSTRAQVFAWYDYIKSELPDVFFVAEHNRVPYPLNFAANPYPWRRRSTRTQLWATTSCPCDAGTVVPAIRLRRRDTSRLVHGHLTAPPTSPPRAFTRTWVTCPPGYDGIDNDGNGLIDNWAEGVEHPPSFNADPQAVATGAGATSTPTSTTRRGQRRSMPSWSRAWGPWARSSAATTSATAR